MPGRIADDVVIEGDPSGCSLPFLYHTASSLLKHHHHHHHCHCPISTSLCSCATDTSSSTTPRSVVRLIQRLKMPSKLPLHCPSEVEMQDPKNSIPDSGYVSASSSDDCLPEIVFTRPHLQFLNRQLQFLEPQGESCQCIPHNMA